MVYAHKSHHNVSSYIREAQSNVVRVSRTQSHLDGQLVLESTATLAELYFLLYVENGGQRTLLADLFKRDSYEEALAYCIQQGLI